MNKTEFIERFAQLFPLAAKYWKEHFLFIPDYGFINENMKIIFLLRDRLEPLDPLMLKSLAVAAFDFDCDYDDWKIIFFHINRGDLQEIDLIKTYYDVMEKEHSPQRRQ